MNDGAFPALLAALVFLLIMAVSIPSQNDDPATYTVTATICSKQIVKTKDETDYKIHTDQSSYIIEDREVGDTKVKAPAIYDRLVLHARYVFTVYNYGNSKYMTNSKMVKAQPATAVC